MEATSVHNQELTGLIVGVTNSEPTGETQSSLVGDVSVFQPALTSLPTPAPSVPGSSFDNSKYPQDYPQLITRLKDKINDLQNNASSTRRALHTVEVTVEKMELKAERREDLMKQTQEIRKARPKRVLWHRS